MSAGRHAHGEEPTKKRTSFVWKEIASGANSPGPRSRHTLIYNQVAQASILFGGIVWQPRPTLRADTWQLKDEHWTELKIQGHPRARHRGAMAYDLNRSQGILFGGQNSRGDLLADTWALANGKWSEIDVQGDRPEGRCGHCLAYDESQKAIVLYGGVGANDRALGDTWLFDGSSWKAVSGDAPPKRRYAAFAYDLDLKGCILQGGSEDDHGQKTYGDTRLFRENVWKKGPASFETDPRDDHGMGYHRVAKQLVMLEGVNAARGILVRDNSGWHPADVVPLHPRHQCSPLAWDENLKGLVLHGGEAQHGGPQFDATRVLQLAG